MTGAKFYICNRIRERNRLYPSKVGGVLLALSLIIAGCVSRPAAAVHPRPPVITEVNLLSVPVALNLDVRPGADGVQIRVFFVAEGHAETVPMTTGNLEIVAYDGTINSAQATTPFHVWHFDQNALVLDAFNSAVGTGYNLVLSWVPKILTHKRVTIVAKYLPIHGSAVVSAATSIAATSQ